MTMKSEGFGLPALGFVFWPVGTGDSTTIVVKNGIIVQVDLHHLGCSTDDGDPRTPIVDRLVALLPKVNGRPYLAVFVLTHPDEDHSCGFAELLKRVTIGELWFSPRVFREYKKDLCEDAKAFCKEATRRVRKTIANPAGVASGDRVRIIGYDELLQEQDYAGFPKGRLTVPGSAVTVLDGVDQAASFRAFVHAPFKDDCDGERNDTSIALQLRLIRGPVTGHCLLLGDHCYPTLKKIFDLSTDEDLAWNVMLAPHHCSKSAMYWKDEGAKDETLKQDILDAMEDAQLDPGHIVASSEPIPESNQPGDNPPHARAKRRYEEIANDGFLCTQEHPNRTKPEPIVFELTAGGLELRASKGSRTSETEKSLSAAVVAARGSSEPPKDRVGFGKKVDD
jgi:beta-lactamase superfamily II metal-dependent hydrolase